MDNNRDSLNKQKQDLLVDIMICPSKDSQFSPEDGKKNDNTKKRF